MGGGVWWVERGLIATVVEAAVSYGDMRSAEEEQCSLFLITNRA
jgi:hypothetical protein